MIHPRPWRVDYLDDVLIGPRVVDSNGKVVVIPNQYVKDSHKEDVTASAICGLIVAAVNKYKEEG